MLRKSSAIALIIFSSSLFASAAETGSTSSSEKERGPWAALKRTWSAGINGVESVGKGVASPVVGLFKSNGPAPKVLNLEVKVQPSPLIVSVAKDRQIKIGLRLYNNAKQAQLLQFNTTQRADAVIRDESGKIVARASEDRQFSSEATVVTVNPHEYLEFELALPTRELSVGKVYTIEAAVTNQEGLRFQGPVNVLP